MTRFSFSSLRARLLLLVLLAVVPALGLIIYTAAEMRRSASVEAQTNALRLAQSAASSQDDLIEGARQLLIALAQLPEVRKQDSEACNALFARLMKQFPLYVSLGAVDAKGNAFCSAIPISKSVNAADRTWFQRAVQTRGFAIGDYTIGRVSGKASLNFGYPVLDDNGAVQAVVLAALDLAWLNKLIAKAQLPSGTTFTVIDRKGTILGRYPDPEKWVGKSMPNTPLKQTILSQAKGAAEAPGMDGIPRLYGFSPLEDTGSAYVSIGIPRDVAFATANRLLARNLVALGIVGVLAVMAAWFGSDFFVLRQVNSLTGASRRLSEGDLSARTEIPYGKGELSELARAFDQMAASMQQLITERKRAEQRLASLHEINVATTSSLDLRAVLNVLMEKIEVFLPYTAVLVWLRNRESGLLERAACWNLDEEDWKGRKLTSTPSLVRAAIEGKMPVVARNVQTDPRTLDPEFYRRNSLIAYLGLPLLVKDEVLGVLVFLTREEHEFTQEEVEFLSTLAGQAAIAIHNARLHEQTERRRREAEELARVAKSLTETLDVTAVGERIVTSVRELFGVNASTLRLLQPDGSLRTLASSGEGFSLSFGGDVLPAGTGLAGVAVTEGRSIWSADILNEPRIRLTDQMRDYQLRSGNRSMIAVPLRAHERIIGSLGFMDQTGRTYSSGEVALVQTFADQAAVAIENARLYEGSRKREEIQNLLKEVSQDITSLDIDSLLRRLTEKVRGVLRVDVSDARIVEKGIWRVIGASGLETHVLNPPGSGTKRGLSNWMQEHRRPLMIPDIMRTDLPTGTTLKNLGLHGYLGVPLFSRAGEVIGVLRALTYQPREFTQEEVDLLQQLANGAAIALENAQLLEQTKRQAIELEEASRMQADFTAMIAHDLRSPLVNVIGAAGMIQDGLFGPVNEEQKKWLSKIETNSRSLVSLISDYLDFSKLEAGRIDLAREEVDLERLIRNSLDNFQLLAQDKTISVQTRVAPDLPRIKADPRRLDQVLANLISNAIKFTGEGGEIEVGARRDGGVGARVWVKDSGAGIPPQEMGSLFEKYRQTASGKAAKEKGTGLGLVICKMIVEAHGGKIWVESGKEKGAIFTFTLPYGG